MLFSTTHLTFIVGDGCNGVGTIFLPGPAPAPSFDHWRSDSGNNYYLLENASYKQQKMVGRSVN
jgi:hypothetical protein